MRTVEGLNPVLFMSLSCSICLSYFNDQLLVSTWIFFSTMSGGVSAYFTVNQYPNLVSGAASTWIERLEHLHVAPDPGI